MNTYQKTAYLISAGPAAEPLNAGPKYRANRWIIQKYASPLAQTYLTLLILPVFIVIIYNKREYYEETFAHKSDDRKEILWHNI
jgi:hypothetical protein